MVTGWRRPAWSVPYQVRRAQEHPERGMNWKVWRSVMATVLVVEDEGKLRELVRSYLERAGFSVLSTGSGAEAVTMAAAAAPDLVVLYLSLPDMPAETVARELRALAAVPIVMLTAKSAEEDRIAGLEMGADDYVTKPFSPRELVLRVRAVLRRGSPATDGAAASYGGGAVVIDESRREVTVRGQAADLTPTEWGVLTALAAVPGRVYSRYELINRVRGYEFAGYERTVDSHVKNLRRKIGDDPASPEIVQTVLINSLFVKTPYSRGSSTRDPAELPHADADAEMGLADLRGSCMSFPHRGRWIDHVGLPAAWAARRANEEMR
jgi:DNA-binding response OmpR family regulator